MRRRSVALLSILTLAAGLLGITGAHAGGPITLAVDDDGMAVPGNCDSATATFTTIQAAVDAALAGDTIQVCPGTYEEQVYVDKTLELLGAQAGIDGRTRPGTPAVESVLDSDAVDQTGIYVDAPNVVINGFLIQGYDAGISTNIIIDPVPASGLRVLNNILFQNGTGLQIESDNSLVRRNLFEDNVLGIHMLTGTKATFTTNEFLGNHAVGILLEGCFEYCDSGINGFGPPTDVTISTNEIVGPEITETGGGGGGGPTVGIEAHNTTGVRITGNNISVVDFGIWLAEGNDAVTVETNTVDDTGIALLLGFLRREVNTEGIGGGPNSNVTVKSNRFTNSETGIEIDDFSLSGNFVVSRNTITGNDDWGIVNFSSAQVNAAENWWGAASGPSDWSTGTGDSVSPNVRFFPWSTNATFTTFAKCKNKYTAGNDTVNGTTGNDILCGGGGQDTIDGKAGNDLILGDAGSDILMGALGADAILAGQGDDTLRGNAGFDSLQGQANYDFCDVGVDSGQIATCEEVPIGP